MHYNLACKLNSEFTDSWSRLPSPESEAAQLLFIRSAVRITPLEGVYMDSYIERIYVFRCLRQLGFRITPHKGFMRNLIRIISPFRYLLPQTTH
jgi:hypothetical protein